MCKLSTIFKRTSDVLIIVITLAAAIFLIAPSDAMATGTTHTITIINNCSDNLGVDQNGIYVGLSSQGTTRPTSAYLNTSTDLCTGHVGGDLKSCPMGWNMKKGDVATITVPMPWVSGAIWARTGCEFDGKDNFKSTCKTPTQNCCDTGGCTDASGKNFQIDCGATPVPPVTLSEYTFQGTVTGIPDFIDTSVISGANVSVQVKPGAITRSGDPYAININNANAVFIDNVTTSCTDDMGCEKAGNYFKCAFLPCSGDKDCTNMSGLPSGAMCINNSCSTGVCSNPYWGGNPGCTDLNGCAPAGLDQSLLKTSGWGNIPCTTVADCPDSKDTCVAGSCVAGDSNIPYFNYALNNKEINNSCPKNVSLPMSMTPLIKINTLEFSSRGTNGQLNQGTKYVGCMSPQVFCRKPCLMDSECPMGQTCGVDDFCSLNGQTVGAPCDAAINDKCTTDDDCVNPATCDSGMCKGTDPSSGFDIITTRAGDLWGCTGTNSGSCYSNAPNTPQVCTQDSDCTAIDPNTKCVQQCGGTSNPDNIKCTDTKQCNTNSECGNVGTSTAGLCINNMCVAQSFCVKTKSCSADGDCPKPGGGNFICNTDVSNCTQPIELKCLTNDFCAPSNDADIGALPLIPVPVPLPITTPVTVGITCTDHADCDPSDEAKFGKEGAEAYKFTNPLTCSKVRCKNNKDCQSGICTPTGGAPGTFGTCSKNQCVFQEFSCQTDMTKPNFGQCVNPNCCGCPMSGPVQLCITGNNNVWQEMAQSGIAEIFKTASETSYSFPFDDKTSTFNLSSQVGPAPVGTFNGCNTQQPNPNEFCRMITGDSGATCNIGQNICVASRVTSYTVTFCPAP